ncbi:MAG: hypothetical protein V7736_09205 [Colwellia polaris]|jgi:hypothetical protein
MNNTLQVNEKNSISFLSLFDNRLRPKGSRDPLGSEAVWGSLGRRLVGNLTTVTSNLDNFVVAILSCDYAHRDLTGKAQVRDVAQLQERFARMEQLLAYVRLSFPKYTDQQGVLGITKAKARLNNDVINLGLAYPLLTNQLSMGLWGYYSPAMARANLLELDNRKLLDVGQRVVDDLKSEMGSAWDILCKMADKGEFETLSIQAIATEVEGVFYNSSLRKNFVDALIEHNTNCMAQSQLYIYAKNYIAANGEDGLQWRAFLQHIVNCKEPTLNEPSNHITQVEPLLVINNHVFSWLQGQHDKPKKVIIDELENCMNVSGLQIPDINFPHQKFLQKSAELLNRCTHLKESEEQSYQVTCEYLDHLLKYHRDIMKGRQGAPWVEFRDDKLFVRVVSTNGKLPVVEDGFKALSLKVENSYFLHSFLSIAKQGIHKEVA